MYSYVVLLLSIGYYVFGGHGGGGVSAAETQRGYLIFALLVVFILGYSLYEYRVRRKRR